MCFITGSNAETLLSVILLCAASVASDATTKCETKRKNDETCLFRQNFKKTLFLTHS